MTAARPSVPSPGKVLLESYLHPLGISQSQLARAIGRPQSGVSDLVHGRRALTVEMAWQLGQALGTDPAYWLGLEAAYRLALLDAAKLPEVKPLVGPDAAFLDETPGDETAGDAASGDAAPSDEAPGDGTPGDAAAAEEAS